jgi:uncharacterized protein YbaA (DUF1428 family)
MAAYVDGFVLVVPKKNVAAYRRMAREAGALWRKFGALDYKECMGDDVTPKTGGMKILTFPRMIKLKRGETVWFSYILYKSRAHRDAVNARVMVEMDKKYKNKKDIPMPFDMKRMAYGGFNVVVEARK